MRSTHVINRMIADTSDLRALGATHRDHAGDLAAIAAALTAATVGAGTLGPVGASYLAALNQALAHAADHAELLAERLTAATATVGATATSFLGAESHAGQSIQRVWT